MIRPLIIGNLITQLQGAFPFLATTKVVFPLAEHVPKGASIAQVQLTVFLVIQDFIWGRTQVALLAILIAIHVILQETA